MPLALDWDVVARAVSDVLFNIKSYDYFKRCDDEVVGVMRIARRVEEVDTLVRLMIVLMLLDRWETLGKPRLSKISEGYAEVARLASNGAVYVQVFTTSHRPRIDVQRMAVAVTQRMLVRSSDGSDAVLAEIEFDMSMSCHELGNMHLWCMHGEGARILRMVPELLDAFCRIEPDYDICRRARRIKNLSEFIP